MRAGVLLLLQWVDARDKSDLPGKLLEYFFARRPILFIGCETGIAAQMVCERNAGCIKLTRTHSGSPPDMDRAETGGSNPRP
jgi:hypothetical protein